RASLLLVRSPRCSFFLLFVFFFIDAASTEIYSLSLHDALPISCCSFNPLDTNWLVPFTLYTKFDRPCIIPWFTSFLNGSSSCTRSEEHTSELQSRENLVCRLLLEKKNFMLSRCLFFDLQPTLSR